MRVAWCVISARIIETAYADGAGMGYKYSSHITACVHASRITQHVPGTPPENNTLPYTTHPRHNPCKAFPYTHTRRYPRTGYGENLWYGSPWKPEVYSRRTVRPGQLFSPLERLCALASQCIVRVKGSGADPQRLWVGSTVLPWSGPSGTGINLNAFFRTHTFGLCQTRRI